MFDVSLPWANFWYDAFNVMLFVGAFAVAVGTYGSIKMGAIKEQFSDERTTALETQTEQAKAELGVAQADIAKANAQIATANEGAAKANERAAALEKDAANARLETEKLKQVVAWRSIPATNAMELEKTLAAKPGSVNLRYMDGDPESLYLAIQISQILGRSNWQVAPGAVKPSGTLMFGISIANVPNSDAQTLRAAFSAAKVHFTDDVLPRDGVSFSVSEIPGAPILMIGSRAPPQLP